MALPQSLPPPNGLVRSTGTWLNRSLGDPNVAELAPAPRNTARAHLLLELTPLARAGRNRGAEVPGHNAGASLGRVGRLEDVGQGQGRQVPALAELAPAVAAGREVATSADAPARDQPLGGEPPPLADAAAAAREWCNSGDSGAREESDDSAMRRRGDPGEAAIGGGGDAEAPPPGEPGMVRAGVGGGGWPPDAGGGKPPWMQTPHGSRERL
eukprot:TRINITY_DN50_c0_g1_i3.p2 TRINITY_DN50_c0_g1~~TRINITY_DN50_c0_g1_i3.p2  ORF type:complete len:212 (-),score=8.74 TRINITY_DN50_c0_g1_i3:421-1056(-)